MSATIFKGRGEGVGIGSWSGGVEGQTISLLIGTKSQDALGHQDSTDTL